MVILKNSHQRTKLIKWNTLLKKTLEGVFLSLGVVLFLCIFLFGLNYFLKLSPSPLNEFLEVMWVAPEKYSLTTEEKKLLTNIFEKGHLISPETIMVQTMSYYENLITFLGILFACLGVLAFTYIKVSSNDHLEKTVETSVQEKTDATLNSHQFHEEIKRIVIGAVEYATADIDSLYPMSEKVQNLEDKIKNFGEKIEAIEEAGGLPDELSDTPNNQQETPES